MAVRNIIRIDEQKCNGCGLCAQACAEGAIQIKDGKARLVSEIYCDGLGACIGHCPEHATTIEQRETHSFDEQATRQHLAGLKEQEQDAAFVCPGIAAMQLPRSSQDSPAAAGDVSSQLRNWPIQLKLVSAHASCFEGAHLLLVADCVPFAAGDFHSRFLRGRSIMIGCPKLDDARFYVEKLAEILRANKPTGLTVVHMEVPCCHGLTGIAGQAVAKTGREMAFEDVTVGLQGNIERVEEVHTA